jgi:hypothetical protein
MAFEMRGLQGQLKYGYQPAAQIGSWVFSDGNIEAAISEKNPLWIESRPLSLWLDIGSKYWVWRQVEVISIGETLACRVSGSPEIRGA